MRLTTAPPPSVVVGHFPDYVEILYGPHRLQPLVDRLRADVEGHEHVLRRIVRDRIELKSPLEFEFSYAAVDTAAGIVLLRYFAPHPDPVLVAGWQAQLIYRLPRGSLDRVYVEEVPLE